MPASGVATARDCSGDKARFHGYKLLYAMVDLARGLTERRIGWGME